MLSRKFCVKSRRVGLFIRNGLSLGIGIVLLTLGSSALAQQPHGWISNGHVSAYTLAPGEFELSISALRVNDTVDFLNLREDLLSSNNRLLDNSGDLDGIRGEIRFGVWRGLELFYGQQQQDMTLKIGSTTQANIEDLSQQLSTTSKRWGARFVLFEAQNGARDTPTTSAALELSQTDNRSKDFDGNIRSINFSANSAISFDPPQRFAMDNLHDDGWQAKLIYTTALGNSAALSLWAGYGEADATSGTSTEIEFAAIRNAFKQTFAVTEKLYTAGLNVNLQPVPRLPVQLGYEHIRVNSRETIVETSNSPLIPGFLRGSNLDNSATSNHTVYGNISWWFNPQLYASLGGKLFRNQFVGIMPHFNNPLSARFSETTYGYVEASIGFKLGR